MLACIAQAADTISLPNCSVDTIAPGSESTASDTSRRTVVSRITNLCDQVIELRDSILPRKGGNSFDTLFIEEQRSKFSFGLRMQQSGMTFTGVAYNDVETPVHTRDEFGSRMSTTLGATVDYRGLSVSFGFNPAKLFRDNSSTSTRIRSYGNRLGFDFLYGTDNDLLHYSTYDSAIHYQSRTVKKKELMASGYYVFNARRFSYPAALTQRWKQKRNAGSVIANATYFRHELTDKKNGIQDAFDFQKTTTFYGLSIGGGYGYNLVWGKQRWMAHLSAIPALVVYNEYKTDLVNNGSGSGFLNSTRYSRSRFPNFNVAGSLAIVRYMKNSHLCLSSTVRTISLYKVNNSKVNDTNWLAQISYGYAFF